MNTTGVCRFLCCACFILGLAQARSAQPRVLNEFPFEFRAGLIWVEVAASGSARPLHFLLDSGSEVSVLNLKTARKLHVKLGQRVEVRGVERTCSGYWPQCLGAKVGAIELPSEYLVVDLGRLNRACSDEVDGLIGADFFAAHVVRIDFATHTIQIVDSACLSPGAESIGLESRKGGLVVSARVDNGPSKWMRLDTGCATALEWVASDSTHRMEEQQIVAVAPADPAAPKAQTSLRLGNLEFNPVSVGLHDRELFAGESGLIGNGILSRCEAVTIDTGGSRMILEQDTKTSPNTVNVNGNSAGRVWPGRANCARATALLWNR